jgi:hypothetical protein
MGIGVSMTLDLEKLSTEIKDLNDNCPVHVRAGDLRELVERIERMETTLEFYANASYERTVEDDLGYKANPEMWVYNEPDILEDGGQRAREAISVEDK